MVVVVVVTATAEIGEYQVIELATIKHHLYITISLAMPVSFYHSQSFPLSSRATDITSLPTSQSSSHIQLG